MCTGIAIALGELPSAFGGDGRVADRLYQREGRDELQFHWWQTPAHLPVQWEGALQLLPWGSRNRRGGCLTAAGFRAGISTTDYSGAPAPKTSLSRRTWGSTAARGS